MATQELERWVKENCAGRNQKQYLDPCCSDQSAGLIRLPDEAQEILVQYVLDTAFSEDVPALGRACIRRRLGRYLCKLQQAWMNTNNRILGDLVGSTLEKATQYVASIFANDFGGDKSKALFAPNVGLHNRGSFCWLNSILAILSRLDGIREYLSNLSTIPLSDQEKARLSLFQDIVCNRMKFAKSIYIDYGTRLPQQLGFRNQCESIEDFFGIILEDFPPDLVQLLSLPETHRTTNRHCISLQEMLDSYYMRERSETLPSDSQYLLIGTTDAIKSKARYNVWNPQRIYLGDQSEYRLVAAVKWYPAHYTAIVRHPQSTAAVEYNDKNTTNWSADKDILGRIEEPFVVVVYKLVHSYDIPPPRQIPDKRWTSYIARGLDYHGNPPRDILYMVQWLVSNGYTITLESFWRLLYLWWGSNVRRVARLPTTERDPRIVWVASDETIPGTNSSIHAPALEMVSAVHVWGILHVLDDLVYLFPIVYIKPSDEDGVPYTHLIGCGGQYGDDDDDDDYFYNELDQVPPVDWITCIFDRRPTLRNLYDNGNLMVLQAAACLATECGSDMSRPDPRNDDLGKTIESQKPATGSSGSREKSANQGKQSRQVFRKSNTPKYSSPTNIPSARARRGQAENEIGQANRRPSGVYGPPSKSKQRTPTQNALLSKNYLKKGRSAENVSPRYLKTKIPSAKYFEAEEESKATEVETLLENEQTRNQELNVERNDVAQLANSKLGVEIDVYDSFVEDMEKLFNNIKAYINKVEKSRIGEGY